MNHDKLKYVDLQYNITQDMMGTYIQLPFQVPENVQQMTVHYGIDESDMAGIDIGLEDINGYRGWSNLRKDKVIIREDFATQGYLAGPILAGDWAIILGIFYVEGSCKITLHIRMEQEEDKWYKGDLHTHSLHSDGDFDLPQVFDYVRQEKLDFIALTDHNTFSQNYAYTDFEDLVIIPGVELTTYKGHANFFGIKQPFSHFKYQCVVDIKQYMEEGKANNAIISLNHPFHKDMWQWGLDDFDFSHVEIWNAWFSEGNQKAVNWWHSKLCEGKKIIAVGGSDFHRIEPKKWYGIPTTWVKASTYSTNGILEGIREGKVCVSADLDAPMIDMCIENISMGDTYKTNQVKEVELTCFITNTQTSLLQLYSSKGLIEETRLEKNHNKIVFHVNTDELFYRVEIRTCDKKEPLCIGNPIFIDYIGNEK